MRWFHWFSRPAKEHDAKCAKENLTRAKMGQAVAYARMMDSTSRDNSMAARLISLAEETVETAKHHRKN